MADRHKSQPFRVRLPEDDRNWLLKHAEAAGLAINAVIAAAIREYRSRREDPSTPEARSER